MDALHARLATIGLRATHPYGFALAGGYAVQAHGFLRRRSDDVDLFTNDPDPDAFSAALDATVVAYQDSGLKVSVQRSGDLFARLSVLDEDGNAAKVELGCDWRSKAPQILEIGPVLHPDDAVANKVTALFGLS